MLYIVLAYLMLFAALTNAVCLSIVNRDLVAVELLQYTNLL